MMKKFANAKHKINIVFLTTKLLNIDFFIKVLIKKNCTNILFSSSKSEEAAIAKMSL